MHLPETNRSKRSIVTRGRSRKDAHEDDDELDDEDDDDDIVEIPSVKGRAKKFVSIGFISFAWKFTLFQRNRHQR